MARLDFESWELGGSWEVSGAIGIRWDEEGPG